jgi:DNA-binding FadR family transcriptional regulator
VARRHREILDALLDGIVTGRHPPGTLLPKEELIAAEFDVSRGTGREALRALEERRVAAVRHGRGATVLPADEWNTLDDAVAAALVRSRRRAAFVDEVTELRRLLEPAVAELAAERATASQRAALRAASGPLEPRRLVALAAGNRPLAATLRALWAIRSPTIDADRVAAAVADGDKARARTEAARAVDGARAVDS